MSLRARLALVLSGVIVGPLLASWVALGLIVPSAERRQAVDTAEQSAARVATTLHQRCREVGDATQAAANDLVARVTAGREDVATVAGDVLDRAAARHETLTFSVLSAKDGSVIASRAGTRVPAAADGRDPAALAGAVQVSCAESSADRAAPALSESVPVQVEQVAIARVVGRWPVRAETLRQLESDAGLSTHAATLLLTREPSREVVAGTGRVAHRSEILRELGRGRDDGWVHGDAFYSLREQDTGLPFSVLAVASRSSTASRVLVIIFLACSTLLAVAMVGLLAVRLTRPLTHLASVAARFGQGDLGARAALAGNDEVGRLAAAFDTMAERLEATVRELSSSRDALADTFERFGEALGRTHDLDGLLRTMLETAMTGTDAAVGVALLGDESALEERVRAADGHAAATSGALAGITALASEAVRCRERVLSVDVPLAGPALGMPLVRQGRVVGALAVARDVGEPPFEDAALAAVASLVAQAGTAVANVRQHEEARRLSVTDPLTGAGNFRHLSTTLAREVERAHRLSRPLSVLMLDLDHFKQVNDTQGHAFGDAVLREFAKRLRTCLREEDTVARYGGEEFAVVLPETDSEAATRIASRVVSAVRRAPFTVGGTVRSVTVSVGVAVYPVHGLSCGEIMRAADGALYAAKRAGRDRWSLATAASGQQAITVR